MYIGLDLAQNILKYTYASHPEPLFNIPFHTQLLLAWVSALKAYYGIELAYGVGALITVVAGLCKP